MYYDTRSLDNFIRLLFIFVPYYSYTFHILSTFLRFSHILFSLLYISLTRNIFPIPADAVDRRKLGSQLLILNSSFRPHSNFYILIQLVYSPNPNFDCKFRSFEVIKCVLIFLYNHLTFNDELRLLQNVHHVNCFPASTKCPDWLKSIG